jgi:hypothetical protein
MQNQVGVEILQLNPKVMQEPAEEITR